jgi:hypothetical protein
MLAEDVQLVDRIVMAVRVCGGNDLINALVVAPGYGLTIGILELDGTALRAVRGRGFIDRDDSARIG